jgi:uncharacterized protein with HEPN domain
VTPAGRRVADCLADILDAIDRIERYISGVAFDEFAGNQMMQDAVVRNIEIIGEACRSIERADPDFAARNPRFPLRAAGDMRNVLAHAYFGVDVAVVWRTVQTSLPDLKEQVRSPR